MFKKTGVQFQLFKVIGGVVFISLFVLTFYNSMYSRRISYNLSMGLLENMARSEDYLIARKITATISRMGGGSRVITALLENGYKDLKFYESIMHTYVSKADTHLVAGLGVIFEKGVISPNMESLYIPVDQEGNIYNTESFLESDYDNEYYIVPTTQNKVYMSSVYTYEVQAGVPVDVVSYSLPIWVNGKLAGIVLLDIPFAFMQEDVDSIRPLDAGFAVFFDQNGTIMGAGGEYKEYLGQPLK